MALSVTAYEQAEREAISRLPNRAIEAFQPTHFNTVGYPTRIRHDGEVAKYAEVMHEGEADAHISVLGGFTDEEWGWVETITRGVWSLTTACERPTLPRGSLLRSIHVIRTLRKIYGDARPRVFELGPGSGYLGALFTLAGYPYAAMDVTQGFYLYQHAAWSSLAPGGVAERAVVTGNGADHGWAWTAGGAIHVPWWEFASLTPGTCPACDVVVCNRALCEMNPVALEFGLRIARAMLSSHSEHRRFYLFDGWGADVVSTPARVLRSFLRAGFSPAYLDPTGWTGVMEPGPAGGADVSESLGILDLESSNRSFAAVRLVFERGNFKNAEQQLLGGHVDPAPPTRTRADVEELWRSVTGEWDHRSADERFWDVTGAPSFLLDFVGPGRTVRLFGAGSFGQRAARILRDLGVAVRGFIDNDPRKQGELVWGLPVVSLAETSADDMILVATAYAEQVREQLTQTGRVEGRHFICWPS